MQVGASHCAKISRKFTFAFSKRSSRRRSSALLLHSLFSQPCCRDQKYILWYLRRKRLTLYRSVYVFQIEETTDRFLFFSAQFRPHQKLRRYSRSRNANEYLESNQGQLYVGGRNRLHGKRSIKRFIRECVLWVYVVTVYCTVAFKNVRRLDGARGKRQVWRPHVRTWALPETDFLTVLKKVLVTLLRLFGAPLVVRHRAIVPHLPIVTPLVVSCFTSSCIKRKLSAL